LNELNVSFLIDGVRDAEHERRLSAKVQALRDAGAASHNYGHKGAYYDADTFFEVSPVSDLEAAAAKVDFGRVLAVDPATRVLLIDAAAKPTPRPAEGWPGSEALDAYAVRKSAVFAAKQAYEERVKKFGREKVVVVCMPEQPGPADAHPIVVKLRGLAPETTATPFPGFGPQQKNFTYATVAPIENMEDVVKVLAGEPILAVDKERRIVLVGDLAALKPLGPKAKTPPPVPPK
jgi:hypothetical protein